MAYIKFYVRILLHKYWVFWFGLKIGGIPLWHLLIHDLSKFSSAEFMPRFRHQILKVSTYDSEEFQAMCRHHHSRNPHHWQYWVHGDVSASMPEMYVREMVADWLAAEKTYKCDMYEWFVSEYPKMNLHPETRRLLIPLVDRYL